MHLMYSQCISSEEKLDKVLAQGEQPKRICWSAHVSELDDGEVYKVELVSCYSLSEDPFDKQIEWIMYREQALERAILWIEDKRKNGAE